MNLRFIQKASPVRKEFTDWIATTTKTAVGTSTLKSIAGVSKSGLLRQQTPMTALSRSPVSKKAYQNSGSLHA
ncbi:hypothetical protein NK987_19600 [Aquiflexum sp. XJ19-10]|nr:hypothetical protein [Aquiflexum gelatinilyticum]MCS4436607.1 hypothetical protein [Aquiflexum gelatinilyticum]